MVVSEVKVKICGITTMEAAITASKAGADFIGFVFANSRRRITPSAAKIIANYIPDNVKKVGVFVNESPQSINKIALKVGLDYVQLHGDESPTFCTKMQLPVIKAFRVIDKQSVYKLAAYHCDYYLLDSAAGPYRGGNGTTFNWYITNHEDIRKEKLILAGGLTEQNVEDAIRIVQPAVIDVSSGVETDGKKDIGKIKRFVQKAKEIADQFSIEGERHR